jgi:hypothetical protein
MIFAEFPPDPLAYEAGQQWWRTSDSRLFTLYIDADSAQWVSAKNNCLVTDSPDSGEGMPHPPETDPQGNPVQIFDVLTRTGPGPDDYHWWNLDGGLF